MKRSRLSKRIDSFEDGVAVQGLDSKVMMEIEQAPNQVLRLAAKRPFGVAMGTTLMLLLAYPPLGWWGFAWLALVPTFALVAVPQFETKHPYRSIWFSGWIFWGLQVYYVPMPHPALWFAWLLLFTYLSIYPLLLVWVSRKMVHRHGLPMVLAIPITLTALEWIRAHALSGFGFVMLSNSQYEVPIVLQVCDLCGAYGLSFLIALFSGGCYGFISGQRIKGAMICSAVAIFVLTYGATRIAIEPEDSQPLKVAVIQGNIDTRFPDTEEELAEYQRQRFEDYMKLQNEWQRGLKDEEVDVVVWPEGKYPIPDFLPGGGRKEADAREHFRAFHRMVNEGVAENKNAGTENSIPLMIVGANSIDPKDDKYFNSALLIDGNGQVVGRYHKLALVPFGEFIPFSEWFPGLAKMTPVGSGMDAGENAAAFHVKGQFVMPFICFESAITHHVRESIAYLKSLGKEPDIMVNVTDDGWFYGHTALDQHLACNVMRAVENRKPLVVAANTGLSAIIASNGKIIRKGGRRKSEVLVSEIQRHPTSALYASVGDWPVIAMVLFCVWAILLPPFKKQTSPSVAPPPVD